MYQVNYVLDIHNCIWRGSMNIVNITSSSRCEEVTGWNPAVRRLQLLSTHYWICSRSVLTVRFDSKLLSCSSVLETEVLLPSFLRGFGLGRVELLYSCECKGVYAGEGGNFKHRQFCFEHQLSIQAKHPVGRWSAFQEGYSEVSNYDITCKVCNYDITCKVCNYGITCSQ